jgi:hypothetical protein
VLCVFYGLRHSDVPGTRQRHRVYKNTTFNGTQCGFTAWDLRPSWCGDSEDFCLVGCKAV